MWKLWLKMRMRSQVGELLVSTDGLKLKVDIRYDFS